MTVWLHAEGFHRPQAFSESWKFKLSGAGAQENMSHRANTNLRITGGWGLGV